MDGNDALHAPEDAVRRPSARIALLDELRGFAIFCMMFHHCLIAFQTFGLDRMLFSYNLAPLLDSLWLEWVRLPFVMAFLLISGICCNFSHSNIKRGLITLGAAMLVTLAAELVDMHIFFGVLHLFGFCMLIGGLLLKPIQKAPAWVGFLLLGLSFLLYSVPHHQFGLPGITFGTLPDALYETRWLFWLGFPGFDHVPYADYFPLIPWCFVFFAGMIFGAVITKKGWPDWTVRSHSRFFAFIGRHSLIFYLAHMPIFFGLFWLISQLIH